MNFPTAVSSIIEANIAVRRLNAFLNAEELDNEAVTETNDHSDFKLSIKEGTFTWGSSADEAILKDINLEVRQGELVAVVGRVGSGKSSLISALLGEMNVQNGSVLRNGSIAYVPQIAWIRNTTVRENITFMSPYKKVNYDQVVEACALRTDFEILTAGDQTEIGEKGVNISGGQKQRISLARAVYSKSDIYLLDDTLSAVDAHVGKHIFENVLGPQGILKTKTRFLTTNSITFLPECDKIIVLKEGRIFETGTYDELMAKSGALSELVSQYIAEKEETSCDEVKLKEYESREAGLHDYMKSLGSSSIKSRASSVISSADFLNDETTFRRFKKEGQLVEEEKVETGVVDLSVYWSYLKQIGLKLVAISSLSYIASEGMNVSYNIWLSIWSNDALSEDPRKLVDFRAGIYATLGVLAVIFYICALLCLCYGHIKACAKLHKNLLHSVLRSPMAFFDTTPIGRIINRFSKDVNTMDITLLIYIKVFMKMSSKTIGSFITIIIQTPLIILVFIPMFIIYVSIQRLYLKSSRQIKRIEAVNRSPMFSHFSESITGSSSIRAYNCASFFEKEFRQKVDNNQASFYIGTLTSRWLEQFVLMIGSQVILYAGLFSVFYRGQIDPGSAGLSVSYAMSIVFYLNMTIQLASFIETNIVSAERILEYTHLPPEAPWDIPSKRPKRDWPQKGVIEFTEYKTKYRPELDLVLRGINFRTKPGEKIGVCGRTGAGKSSLTLSLFRIIESVSGQITLDSIDISHIGLHDLRSRLTIIPQDPILFTGDLRFNLDPLEEHTDQEIWHALELSHLKNFVSTLEGGLEYQVSESGGNMSVGQRQLVCLARALLRKTKVLVLDEATAAVDLETDDLIQETIRRQFADCTIITIAHRLNTIMDSSRIMVLSAGEIIEMDSPAALMANKNSAFYKMTKDIGLK